MHKSLVTSLIALLALLSSCGTSAFSSGFSSPQDSSSTTGSIQATSSFSNEGASRPSLGEIDQALFGYIAHRGLHDEAKPDNSLSAFTAAMDLGLAIETDVHLTKDKKLVVSHDSSLPGFGNIEANTLEDIQAGYVLSNGEKIPSFLEMIAALPEEKMIVLELKVPDGVDGAPIAKALMEETKGLDLERKLVVISFNVEALSALSSSSFNRGLLVSGDYNLDIFKSLSQFALATSFCEFYSLAFTLLNDSEATSYRQRGGKLLGWTFTSQALVDTYAEKCDGYTFDGFSPRLTA